MAPRAERKLAGDSGRGRGRLQPARRTDEVGTLARLKALLKELIEPLISEYHVRIVKLMGDGALVEFASAVGAVECAAAVQHGVVERDGSLPENRRIEFPAPASTLATSSSRTATKAIADRTDDGNLRTRHRYEREGTSMSIWLTNAAKFSLVVALTVALNPIADAAEKREQTYTKTNMVSASKTVVVIGEGHELTQELSIGDMKYSNPDFKVTHEWAFVHTDSIDGSGKISAYFVDFHEDGNQTYGTAEGTVKTTASLTVHGNPTGKELTSISVARESTKT